MLTDCPIGVFSTQVTHERYNSYNHITESNTFVHVTFKSSEIVLFAVNLSILSFFPCGILFEQMIYRVFGGLWVPIEALKAFSMAHCRLATGKMAHLASQCFFGVQSEKCFICG